MTNLIGKYITSIKASLLIPVLLLFACFTYGQSGTWNKLADMSVKRLSAGAAAANGKIYVFGGETTPIRANEVNYIDVVEEYDPSTNVWTTKNKMPLPLSFPITAVVNDRIYLIGGQTSGYKDTTLVFQYNPLDDSWTRKADAPTTFFLSGVVVHKNKVFISKGNHLYIYDPQTDTWDNIKLNTFIPLANCLAVVNNKIWSVSGGNWGSETTIVIEYNEDNNRWQKKTDIPIARSEHSVITLNNKMYLIGGCNSTDHLISKFFCYDIAENKWNELIAMPEKLHFPGIVEMNGKIYVVGGAFGLYRPEGIQKTLYCYNPETISEIKLNSINKEFNLLQNYPNPFNPVTEISYQISEANYVRINVYDGLGKYVTTLVDNFQNAGLHKVNFDGSNLNSGVYFYTLSSGNFFQTRKMILLK